MVEGFPFIRDFFYIFDFISLSFLLYIFFPLSGIFLSRDFLIYGILVQKMSLIRDFHL